MTVAQDVRGDVRARIVEAAARRLHDGGAAGVTTRGVAEDAGVQAPTIYRLFGDKDGLLEAVAEHVLAAHVAAKAAIVDAAAAADVDPVDELCAGWRTQLEFAVANPMLFALLSDPDRASRSAAAQAGRRVLAARVHRIAEAGRLRVGERRAIDLIEAAGTGAITTLLSTPTRERDPELAQAMLEAVLRQILTDRRASLDHPALTAVVTARAVTPVLDMLTGAERQLMAEWLDRAIEGLQAPAADLHDGPRR